MTVWPAFENFLFSLIGALIGGSFVAWVSGYYSEKGKRDLLREEWPKLLAEAKEKAYQEESGRRLATKDDVENILQQVRAVTRETELVKAEISGGLWHGQWRLAQKRDSYVRLIDAVENIRLTRTKIKFANDENSQKEAREQERMAIEEFRRARAVARLLLPPEVIDAIGPFLRQIRNVDPSSSTLDVYRSSEDLIQRVRDQVVEMGKTELGLS